MLIFAICACAFAAYFAGALHFNLGFSGESVRTPLARVIQRIALLAPMILAGAVQYWKLEQSGASGSRLWLAVTGTAIGAPIVGIIVMLIVVFAIFGKTP